MFSSKSSNQVVIRTKTISVLGKRGLNLFKLSQEFIPTLRTNQLDLHKASLDEWFYNRGALTFPELRLCQNSENTI